MFLVMNLGVIGCIMAILFVVLPLYLLGDYLENRNIKKALMKAGVKEEDITIIGNTVTYKYPVTEENNQID